MAGGPHREKAALTPKNVSKFIPMYPPAKKHPSGWEPPMPAQEREPNLTTAAFLKGRQVVVPAKVSNVPEGDPMPKEKEMVKEGAPPEQTRAPNTEGNKMKTMENPNMETARKVCPTDKEPQGSGQQAAKKKKKRIPNFKGDDKEHF